MSLAALQAKVRNDARKTIQEKVTDTLGENPCRTLILLHENGDRLALTCNRKRCTDCGTRKQLTLQLQMEAAFGETVWVSDSLTRTQIQTALEAAKKRKQRLGTTFTYQVVGDDSLGYIIISDSQLHEQQRHSYLNQWVKRILNRYHMAARRIRRSLVIGSMSLVPLRKKSNRGQPSPWTALTGATRLTIALSGDTYETFTQDMELKQHAKRSGNLR